MNHTNKQHSIINQPLLAEWSEENEKEGKKKKERNTHKCLTV